MILGAGALLGLLSSRSAAAPRPAAIETSEAPAFDALLEKARAGEISSGRAVTIGKRAEVKLSEEQLQRLAVAADRAEAQGATRALVLIDGMALHLDITMREVTKAVDMNKPGVLTEIDAFVRIADVPGRGSGAGGPGGSEAARLSVPNLILDPRG